MTAHRILQLNGSVTALCALAMLATRGTLPSLFGLASPSLLDVIAVGLIGYAAALMIAAARRPVSARTLLAFTAADAVWVVGSALVLIIYWPQLAPLARFLVIACALAVELLALLQYRAAGAIRRDSPELA